MECMQISMSHQGAITLHNVSKLRKTVFSPVLGLLMLFIKYLESYNINYNFLNHVDMIFKKYLALYVAKYKVTSSSDDNISKSVYYYFLTILKFK